MTAMVDEDIAGAFNAALAQDAGVTAPAGEPAAPAPPRKAEPVEVADKPARKPRPSKPKADDAPRTAPVAVVTAEADKGDYTEGLMTFGGQVWLAASAVRGGKIPIIGIPLPDARPYAWAFKRQLPALVAAANQGAKQSATVRRHVVKWTGDGSKSWVLGAGIAVMGLLGACIEIAQAPAEARAQLAAANDAEMQAEVERLIEALGLAETEEQAA